MNASEQPAAMEIPRFQFLGIPPKGELNDDYTVVDENGFTFPISRDPPEGGTPDVVDPRDHDPGFQFLGIPPKGELYPY